MTTTSPLLKKQSRLSPPAQAFFLALLTAFAIFLPFVLFDRGYFIYYGDFNVQQIPFYMLAHDAVRSGDIFWNWYTDLGANFIGSYSFYLLFSPFFWLTLPFPNHFLPHLMAPLLILKTACASLTAYLYLSRFVRDKRYAVVGGLLYAFSGWMTFNIFFNHFHEVAVFFPLLLLSLEMLVVEGRRGFFAAMVFLNAIVNYWFFIGEAVFLILYVIVRWCYNKSWRMTVGRFFHIAWEAILGVGLACFVLLPSALAVMGNPRTGTDALLSGWNFWIYWNDQRFGAILHSLFYPPELPARPNFFHVHGANWASLSAWLPLLGPVAVIAYFKQRRRDWLKTILGICLLFALIPGLNSLFILFNHSYYARWYYMPILLMSLASVRAVEEMAPEAAEFRSALRWQLLIVTGFIVAVGLTPIQEEGEWRIGLAADPLQAWVWFLIAVGCVLLTWALVHFRRRPAFLRIFTAAIMMVSVCFSAAYMANGKITYERSQFVIGTAIGGRYKVSLPDEPFARSDLAKAAGNDNLLMFWRLPNIQAFHSIVPTSIMEFYPAVGVKRDVGSRPEVDYYALRPLLSVRWLFYLPGDYDEPPMPGYTYYDTQNGYEIYQNQYWLPMGFSYDYLIEQGELANLATTKRGNLLLRAIVLDDEGIARNNDILPYLPEKELQREFDEAAYFRDIEARQEHTATGFYRDKRGFGAITDFEQERLVFFSVPFESGWSATVGGEPAQIEKANIGFMAVRVPAGPVEIRFDYCTPGLKTGLLISGGTLGVTVIYLLTAHLATRRKRRQTATPPPLSAQPQSGGVHTRTLTWEEYLLQTGAESRTRLRDALDQAALQDPGAVLPPGERTLDFILPETPPEPPTE